MSGLCVLTLLHRGVLPSASRSAATVRSFGFFASMSVWQSTQNSTFGIAILPLGSGASWQSAHVGPRPRWNLWSNGMRAGAAGGVHVVGGGGAFLALTDACDPDCFALPDSSNAEHPATAAAIARRIAK